MAKNVVKLPIETTLFTPRISADSSQRLEMRISMADEAKTQRGRMWRATVTDHNTGKRYKVRGAACSIPNCICDAVIICEVEK
jgi:hypothetical protein